jgi:hypothetical protein
LKQVALLFSKRNQFSYTTHPGASARRASSHVARRAARLRLLCLVQARRRLLHLTQARRRLLRLRHASGCLDTSRGSSRRSSCRSSSTTPPRAGSVDYFASAVRPGASARRAARRPARHRLLRLAQARRRQLRLTQARRRLLHLRRASGCLSTSRVSSLVFDYFAYVARPGASARRAVHRLSSTTSPTLRDRVPRHVARLVTRLVAPLVIDFSASRGLVVDYSASRRLVVNNSASCRLVVDYFAYAARLGASARRAAHLLSSTTSPTVVWTSLGPLPWWVPGPTTRWAPGTTRLALHGTCWREAQGLQRRSTRLGSCTCPALYRGLLDVLD